MPAPRRRLAAAVVACLLLAACDGSDPTGSDDPTTAPPPPAGLTATATDGGTVEVTEIGFSVLEAPDDGSASTVWAATFQNTSQADLLAYVDFELTWHGPGGETEVVASSETNDASLQRAYDVLPGDTVTIGGRDVVDFVPESLDVSVDNNEWYPMSALDARDLPVGVEVTGYEIGAGATVRVQADFTSSYENQAGDDGLRLLVVLRDAAGTLIGAATAGGDFAAEPAGARVQEGTVEGSLWPEAADVDNSEATIVKACCAWVAAG
jgi:hypothetical protein